MKTRAKTDKHAVSFADASNKPSSSPPKDEKSMKRLRYCFSLHLSVVSYKKKICRACYGNNTFIRLCISNRKSPRLQKDEKSGDEINGGRLARVLPISYIFKIIDYFLT